MCRTWMRARTLRAMRTSRSVQRKAAISSRQTGCDDGSPSMRSFRRSRTRFQIFLVLQSRFTKMHLAVDDSRQDMQAAAVDRLAGRSLAEIADGGDAPVLHADIADPFAIMVDHCAACQDEVVDHGHAL